MEATAMHAMQVSKHVIMLLIYMIGNVIPEYKQREKFNDAYSTYAWKNKL